MRRAGVLAFATSIACAAPALAEPPGQNSVQSLPTLSRFAGEPPVHVDRRGVTFPVIDYTGPGGVLRTQRGIIAGKRVARGTIVGLGIWETAPKARGYVGDVPANVTPKRTRRAAVGLSWRF
jgi:hypothetical protein